MTDYTYPNDIYTEAEADVDTLKNLGPLAPMAGIWEGKRGVDINPKAEGAVKDPYIEHIELHPIDAQANGPQLFYGLRYHLHIIQPDEVETFHDQVGYWLWEPATGNLMLTLSIPRGQTLIATGNAKADDKEFTLKAVRGSLTNGIISNPFIEQNFRTESYTITVKINDDGTWSYDQNTVMIIPNYNEPFEHRDRNRLTKIGEAKLNPTALAALKDVS
ncbi:FABP family protein [Conservatibacter flavescens]|uniref:FABP family protein n=1 Tax=Conservatibacter flavescens TaxID=28161 RepID=A0A2M8S389_9PAST|nr:heme-binding beta-barrel domain-containing protein [Conservatibacter flavescens]PJG85611.1 FABP family protein [Conservatibacter flavescens]